MALNILGAPKPDRGALVVLLAVSLGTILIAATVQTAAGSFSMTWSQAWAALTDANVWAQPVTLLRLIMGEAFAKAHSLAEPKPLATTTLIVWNVRLPRILVGLMVGINLSFSGSIFQAVTRNELASPYLLGVSSGAGLAVLLVLVIFPAWGPILPVAAMSGGAAAFLVVYMIAWNRGTSPVRLVLGGVIVAAIAGSIQTGVFFLARDINVMQNALAWMTGSLTGADWRQVRMIAPWTLITVVMGLSATRNLDVLLLGEPMARALGMPVERTRFLLAGLAIIAAGSSVAVAGLVGFVGLIVPHAVRSLVGSTHRRLLIGCLFAGPALMASADAFARLAVSPTQIPVGIITGLLGGVFFSLSHASAARDRKAMSDPISPLQGLEGQRLRLQYDPHQPVVIDGESILIPLGKISALIGANGSGKSTLLKALARQLPCGSGQVVLDGQDIARLRPRDIARKLGILFQDHVAPGDLTVEQLLYHGRYPHRRQFESMLPEDHAAVDTAIHLAHLEDMRHRLLTQLSGGQSQLAWIAMLLAQCPTYLLLDEPTTFLDLAHQFDVMDMILRLNRTLGKTIVMVVHDLNLAARYADYLFAMREGKIVASGEPEEVMSVDTLRFVFDIETHIIQNDAEQTFFCIPIKRSAHKMKKGPL